MEAHRAVFVGTTGEAMTRPRLAWLALALVMVVLTALAVLIVVERCEQNVMEWERR